MQKAATLAKKKTQETPKSFNQLASEYDTELMKLTNAIEYAKLQPGVHIIEVPAELIERAAPRALETAKWVNYKGVILCPEGTREQVEEEMNLTLEEKLHGKGRTAVNKTALTRNLK